MVKSVKATSAIFFLYAFTRVDTCRRVAGRELNCVREVRDDEDFADRLPASFRD